MANELKVQFTTGSTLYAVVLNTAGQAWNTSTNVFETIASGHWANYALALTESAGTGIYEGNFPTAITSGVYHLAFRQQSGGSPATADINSGIFGGLIYWTGSAEQFASTPGAQMDLVSSPNSVALSSISNSIWGTLNSALTTANTIGQKLASWVLGSDQKVLLSTDPQTGVTIPTVTTLSTAPPHTALGTGPIAINQDTGGADNLRYVDVTGNGIGGASILIYLAADWPANPDRVQATTATGPDGRWLSPAFVVSGTYVAVFEKIGANGPNVSAPFTV